MISSSAATAAERASYLVRSFWSPCGKYLVTAHVSHGQIIALQDDNGIEWEAAGEQQQPDSDAPAVLTEKCPNCGFKMYNHAGSLTKCQKCLLEWYMDSDARDEVAK